MNELVSEAYDMAKDIHNNYPELDQQIVFDIILGLLSIRKHTQNGVDDKYLVDIYNLILNHLSPNDTVDQFVDYIVNQHLINLSGMSPEALAQFIKAMDMCYEVAINQSKQKHRKVTLYDHTINLLTERGIKIHDLAKIVYDGQINYFSEITLNECEDAIKHVLKKREVQNAVITGMYLDKQSREDKNMDPYLKAILDEDSGLYQIDELLSTAVSDVFGGIANSNRGYLDKTKPGIIGEVDKQKNNVFLDDLLASIAAGAEAYIANSKPEGVYRKLEDEN